MPTRDLGGATARKTMADRTFATVQSAEDLADFER